MPIKDVVFDTNYNGIIYLISSHFICTNYKQSSFLKSNDQIRSLKKNLLIYPNVSSLKSKDAIDLYVPILDSKLVWKSVMIDLSLSRMVWMSGAPIYITVKINNPTQYTVRNILVLKSFFFFLHKLKYYRYVI